MSRAYCLTCNEQVMVTASGTCPDGHAVASQDHGPEPWVGRAEEVAGWADEGVGQTGEDPQPATASLHDVDVAELQELQVAGVATNPSNGNGRATANGRHAAGPPRHDVLRPEEAPSPAPVDRQRANSQASDDLAAMLAEALQPPAGETDEAAPADPTAGAHDTPAPTDPAAEPDDAPTPQDQGLDTPQESQGEDWDDLAALAAELQLDTSLPTDAQDDTPAPATGSATWSTPDEEPAWPSEVADDTHEDPSSTPPLPSPAPVEDGDEDPVPPPASEAEEPARDPSVDLTNFTARGARVGASGRTPRRLFGRKR